LFYVFGRVITFNIAHILGLKIIFQLIIMKATKKTILSLSALAIGTFITHSVKAQFSSDPTINRVVRDTAGLHANSSISVTAPNGKTFIVWGQANPSGGGSQKRMQLVDYSGNKQWGEQGILINSFIATTVFIDELTVDKEGNAIYTMVDDRSAPVRRPVIYKIDQNGNSVWGANGVQLVDTTDNPSFGGGATVSVTDSNNIAIAYYSQGNTKTYITLQKFSSAGIPMWSAPKRIIDSASINPVRMERPKLVALGGENFMMVYVKRAKGTYAPSILYAQKYDNAGNELWAAPLRVSNKDISGGGFPTVSSDGYGGVFATFTGYNPSNSLLRDAFAQRIYGDGYVWDSTGKKMIRDSVIILSKNYDYTSVYSPVSNAYFACIALTSSINVDYRGISVQKIDTAGNLLFNTVGGLTVLPVSSGSSNATYPTGFKLKDSGLVVVYTEVPAASSLATTTALLKATKINFSGAPAWPSGPVAISTYNSNKVSATTTDFVNNQAIVAWVDTRTIGMAGNTFADGGIYIQNLNANGTIGTICPHVTLDSFASVAAGHAPFALTGGHPAGGTYTGTGVGNDNSFNPAFPGTYTITYVFESGTCLDSASRTITVIDPLSISTVTQQELFECYPNPTTGQFIVALKQNVSGSVNVKISGIDGRVIVKDSQNSNGKYSKSFDLAKFAKGIYIVEVSSPNGIAVVKLMLK
jgi:hypothetical protein